jgi:hypothetical protein
VGQSSGTVEWDGRVGLAWDGRVGLDRGEGEFGSLGSVVRSL